jgi:hypothetical protein
MANATVSFLGKANNTGDDNALFLKIFSGERLVQNITLREMRLLDK